MRKRMMLWLGIMALGSPLLADGTSVTVANEAGLTYNNTYSANLNGFAINQLSVSKVAAQVTYSSVTFSSASFTDGTQSTGSITVATNTETLASFATNQITVPSTALILGSPATNQFTVITSTGLGTGAYGSLAVLGATGITNTLITVYHNGTAFGSVLNGQDWATADTSSGTASNIATALNKITFLTGVTAAWQGGTSTVVIATATAMTAQTNYYTIGSSTPTAVSTAAFAGFVAPAYVTVNGNVLTNGKEWTAQSTASGTAVSLASAVNSVGGIQAAQGGGTSKVVYATATVVGLVGNGYTLGSSVPTSISTSAVSFSGGLAPALYNQSINFNGNVGRNGYEWTDASATSTGTAISIAAWMNSFTGIMSATASSSVVYATATVASAASNAYTLTASTTNLTVKSATFTNGRPNATLTINGITITAGVDFSTASTVGATATNIAAAINANTGLKAIVSAASSGGTVTTTSTVTGVSANYTNVGSTNAIAFIHPTMTGGTNSGYNITTDLITIPAHGFTKALPVLLSTGGATIGGLVNQTTYYVVVVDANNVGLSSTSAVAQTGAYINITSSSTGTTAHTLTLAPLPFSQGSAGGFWQVSNDGTNWTNYTTTSNNVAVGSQTFTPVYPSTTTVQDFGNVDYGYMRYSALGPTQGGVALKVILNGKN